MAARLGFWDWVKDRADDLGFGEGVTISGGCILGFTVSVMFVEDAQGNAGVVYSAGGGAYLSAGVSVNPTLQASTLQVFEDTQGWGMEAGVSVAGYGAEAALAKDDAYRALNVTTPGPSVGVPADLHCFVTHSWNTAISTTSSAGTPTVLSPPVSTSVPISQYLTTSDVAAIESNQTGDPVTDSLTAYLMSEDMASANYQAVEAQSCDDPYMDALTAYILSQG